MKTYQQFIIEAKTPSQRAKSLGLVGDGHGGWYKRATGEYEAKTVDGKLQFFNKRQIPGQKDPPQTEFEKRIPLGSTSVGTSPQVAPPLEQEIPVESQVPMDSQIPMEPPMAMQSDGSQVPIAPSLPIVEKDKGYLNIVFGRFNPPTIGHLELMDTAAYYAESDMSDYIIVPSRSQDKNKNPLDPDTKIFYMRKLFPYHSERIVNDPNMITIFDVLEKAHMDGYSAVRIFTGPDRVKEFDRLSNKYNGQLYLFDSIEVVPIGEFDADADGRKNRTDYSSSRMRKAAAEGDFLTFRNALPPGLTKKESLEFFFIIRGFMNIKEGYNMWEIAPKYDKKTLREQYINGSIFNIGDIVENNNTGIRGKIIRKGTNYLICVSENKIMFKSWISDLNLV